MIEEKLQAKRLTHFHTVITACYMADEHRSLRSSDGTYRDDVNGGVLVEKLYTVNGRLAKRLTGFDPRMQYTFLTAKSGQHVIACPNCGYKGSTQEMENGCPACGTDYNLEYADKELGAKYHMDQIVNGWSYRIVTGLIDLAISFACSYLYIRSTSRTFNGYDIGKVLMIGLVLALFLYFGFYQLDALIVTLPQRIRAGRRNRQLQAFWSEAQERGIDKKTFFNNIAYELRRYYYGSAPDNANVVDFNVTDFEALKLEQSETGADRVKAQVQVQEVRIKGVEREMDNASKQTTGAGTFAEMHTSIDADMKQRTFTFERSRHPLIHLKGGINVITCPGCGASIDVTEGKCTYCGRAFPGFQEWFLVEKETNQLREKSTGVKMEKNN